MTKDDAIQKLNELYMRADITDQYGDMEDMTPYEEAINMAIKALEQEPVLDKIRVEIEEEYDNCYICEWYEDYDYEENDISEYQSVGTISDILEIIDKYRAESEE